MDICWGLFGAAAISGSMHLDNEPLVVGTGIMAGSSVRTLRAHFVVPGICLLDPNKFSLKRGGGQGWGRAERNTGNKR